MDSDDRALSELGMERRDDVLSAVYSAAMLGLPEQDCRVLLREAGLSYADLEHYTPHVLRLQPRRDTPAPEAQWAATPF